MLLQSKAGPTSKSIWATQTGLDGREKVIESWVSRGVEGKRESVEEQIRSKYCIGNSLIINKKYYFFRRVGFSQRQESITA